jgi:long-chain acyl-CoA synthetase
LSGNLLTRAINAKLAKFRATGDNTHVVYDRLVFAKLRSLLGGRVQYIGTGSAPISPTVFETLKVCFGCEMIEGWGMTETVSFQSRCSFVPPMV